LAVRGLVDIVVSGVKNGQWELATVAFWVSFALGVALAEAISGLSKSFVNNLLFDRINMKVSTTIMEYSDRQDVGFFENPRSHDILERVGRNSAGQFLHLINNAHQFAMGTIQIVSMFGILVMIDPLILMVVVPLSVPYFLFEWRLRKERYLQEHTRATKRRWTQYFLSCLINPLWAPEVKILNLGPLLVKKFKNLMTEFMKKDHVLHRRNFLGASIFSVLSLLSFYGIFFRVVWGAFKGSSTVGDVAIFAGAAARLRRSLESTINSATGVMEASLHISNLIYFLDVKPKIGRPGGSVFRSCHGRISFHDVTFTYPGSTSPALSQVSIDINAGETVAIVGENGAGKTTLIKLLARLYDPDGGYITLDGIDIRDLSVAYLHSQIAMVFQDFMRFSATVGENIAYGDWQRLEGEGDEVKRVAQRADVHEMIETMPSGYDTMLGRLFGEYNPSGGEWQKIAIARAFARDSSILILDEPTANVDARAEYGLFCRLKELSQGKTTILISHRFSTVKMADRIIVMDVGEIVESGTHQELLEKGGKYGTLYGYYQRQMGLSV
jgi:ATP-binding cassette subfamily B protein